MKHTTFNIKLWLTSMLILGIAVGHMSINLAHSLDLPEFPAEPDYTEGSCYQQFGDLNREFQWGISAFLLHPSGTNPYLVCDSPFEEQRFVEALPEPCQDNAVSHTVTVQVCRPMSTTSGAVLEAEDLTLIYSEQIDTLSLYDVVPGTCRPMSVTVPGSGTGPVFITSSLTEAEAGLSTEPFVLYLPVDESTGEFTANQCEYPEVTAARPPQEVPAEPLDGDVVVNTGGGSLSFLSLLGLFLLRRKNT